MKNIDFLILSSIDWDFLMQRHQVFATGFSLEGAVFFVENTGFGKPKFTSIKPIFSRLKNIIFKSKTNNLNPIPKNLKVIAPLMLPPVGKLANLLNQHFFIPFLIKTLKKEGLSNNPVIITYLPTRTSIEIIKKFVPKLIIYDSIASLENRPNAPNGFKKTENELLKLTDIILTHADLLYKKYKLRHHKVFQIHHGVNFKLFNSISHIKGDYKIVGYFGAISQWTDLNIIKTLIDGGYKIKIIGKNSLPININLPKGISIEGPYDQNKLVQKIKNWGSIILPYITNHPYMKGVMPAKIYECLATGKPILSTSLENYSPEIRYNIYICKSPRQFLTILNNLEKFESNKKKKTRIEIAKKHSYEIAQKELIKIIQNELNAPSKL